MFHSIIRDTDCDLVHYEVVYAHVNVYAIVQLLFYNLQRLNRYDNGHTYNVIYDICVFNNNKTPFSGHLYNNNATNNDTPDCISGVENECSGTMRYGKINISYIDIYGVIVVNLAYDSVALVATLETISSLCERGFVRLSSDIKPMPSFLSNISHLSSDLLCMSSDCGIVYLKHVPVALVVASLETISSLSSPYLSPVSKFIGSSSPGLYSSSSQSYTQSPSFISISVPNTEPSFEPSITPSTL